MPNLSFEKSAHAAGHPLVCGIDEAGRGPLAGPVSASAVLLPADYQHPLLDDSKKISEKKRELLYETLTTDPNIRWAHSFADVAEIEQKNILAATHAAMVRAVEKLEKQLGKKSIYCLIDGLAVPRFPYPSEGIVKGDGKSLSIAAASIIAKVRRDRLMVEYATEFPEYGFEKHKGYGTKAHLAALRAHGPTRIHRKTFQPIAQLQMEL